MGNPLSLIDIDGRDWFRYRHYPWEEEKWYWHEGSTYTIRDEYGNEQQLTGYKNVVVFEGSLYERLGTKSTHVAGDYNKTNAYLNGEGAITAKVTVYGPGGEDDVKTYTGYTMSSDPQKYGIVNEGMYEVSKVNKDDEGPYGSLWTLNKRSRVFTYWDNPYKQHQVDRNGYYYMTGVFIHRSNNDGWAGVSDKSTVSKGCLLIAPTDWNNFNNRLEGVESFMLEVRRTKYLFSKPSQLEN